MISLFQSHVNPDGWLLLLPLFTNKETKTQRGEVTSPRKMQQKKAVELGFRPRVTVSEPVCVTQHTTFPLGCNRSTRVGKGCGKAKRPETWVLEQTLNTYSVAKVNLASL